MTQENVLIVMGMLGRLDGLSKESPVVARMNARTIMINGDGNLYLLVYSKEREEEGFIHVEIKDKKLRIFDGKNFIPKKKVSTFEDYKKLDRKIGMKMSAI